MSKNETNNSESTDENVKSVRARQDTTATRRFGTATIIGISAAGVALLAGIFGGGIAVGSAVADQGRAGMSHERGDASGPQQDARMNGGPENGGPQQDGRMNGGPENGGPENGGPQQGDPMDGPQQGGPQQDGPPRGGSLDGPEGEEVAPGAPAPMN